eukprot:TRINITY_DN4979_c0_g1_i1.p1 TRINITY_DN4979_c0_g1~~TRINITY_DN4979_c0_g1_i1.p1  ORF type:complete len:541 (+),score=150.13 TRINITY_DN4979_c0_g1_i1:52-1674(+)
MADKKSLEIWSTVTTARLQHGLRRNDHSRYCKFCTTRTKRIRKSLKITNGRGRFVDGTRKIQKDKLEKIGDIRYVELYLMYAERAWARFEIYRNDIDNPRSRSHAMSRLKKAFQFATQMIEYAELIADPRTLLESKSYSTWISGILYMEHEDWVQALHNFTNSRYIYQELSKIGNIDQNATCLERVEDLTPMIKFCNYKIKNEGLAKLDDTDSKAGINEIIINDVIPEEEGKGQNDVRDVSWAGRRLPIRIAIVRKHLRRAIDAAKNATTIEEYDSSIQAYKSAAKNLESGIKDSQKKGRRDNEEVLELLLDYANYERVDKTMRRNMVLLRSKEEKAQNATAKKGRLEEIVNIYDNLIENAVELYEYIDKENPQHEKDIATKISAFRAIRCYHKCLIFLEEGEYSAASQLLDHCLTLSEKALKQFDNNPRDEMEVLYNLVGQYLSETIARKSYTKALAFSQVMAAKEEATVLSSYSILDNIQEYDSSFLEENRLVDFPPSFEAIPCMPVLFDIALGNIPVPDLSEKKEAPKGFLSRYIFG